MNIRMRRAGLALALVGLWATGAIPALGADNGTVDATVTVATPCILVSPPSLDYATLPFSPLGGQSGTFRHVDIENCGSSGEELFGRGTNAASNGAAVWTLSDTYNTCQGTLNTYGLIARGVDNDPYVFLSTTDQSLETVPAGSSAATENLFLEMPCSGSDGAGETMSFQAIFTATF